jgi:long-chain acyl-CoA synthetase
MTTIHQKAEIYSKNNLLDENGKMLEQMDLINEQQFPTISAIFKERVRRSPQKTAYRQYDNINNKWKDYSWENIAKQVARWQTALQKSGIEKGDRVSIRYKNSIQWVIFDQAAQGLGLVTVPLYVDDRGDNIAYILNNSETKLLYVETLEQWNDIKHCKTSLKTLQKVVVKTVTAVDDEKVIFEVDFLSTNVASLITIDKDPDELVSIVFTSGTTGRPKGVMLSSKNFVSNLHTGVRSIPFYADDELLSFLPLSHTLERTGGYHLSIATGSTMNFARSIAELAEDLQTIKPTILLAVPRIFERIYGKIKTQLEEGSPVKRYLFNKTIELGYAKFEQNQGRAGWRIGFIFLPLLDKIVASKVRAKLGGRIRFSLVGGAALAPPVSRVFIGLGVELLQGYGLTESSPLISISTQEKNIPESIGLPANGVEVAIGENDELLARGPNIMLGYWKDEEATKTAIDDEGWLHTGDKARIDKYGSIHITGRIKEIIVLANGEKMPPNDIEQAILDDTIIEQCMLYGEAKPYLTLLAVVNEEVWPEFAAQNKLDANFANENKAEIEEVLLARVADKMKDFPGYAKVRQLRVCDELWSVDNGLLTPTMKLKRPKISEFYKTTIDGMYQGH